MRISRCRSAASAAAVALFLLVGMVAGQDRPLSADFPEVYRVGGFDAPEWAEFSGAPMVTFDAAGRLYVQESSAMSAVLGGSAGPVVVIDPSGSLVRTIGRQGEGPGEFDEPRGLAVWRDGWLAVADAGHNAYQLFTPDGEFERLIRMRGGSDGFSGLVNAPSRLRPDPAGLALVAQGVSSGQSAFASAVGRMFGAEGAEEGRVDDRGLERLRLDGEGVVAETILEGWRPAADDDELESPLDLSDPSSIIGTIMGGERWFEPELLWDILPDGGIVYSDSTAYRIRVMDPAGRVIRTLTRSFAPKPVTRGVRSAMRDRSLARLSGGDGGDMQAALREQIRNRGFMDEIPVLSALRTTWDGALWIQRRGEEPWDEDGPIDVMRADGAYVGTFAAGATDMPGTFGPDGLVAFVERDELDIPSIVVRRIPAEVR